MKLLKYLAIGTGLLVLSHSAQAVMIDFKALADGSLGESAWAPLMFKADGTHTANAGEAFLTITGTNGADSYAYLDANNAGLGVCGKLLNSNTANTAYPNSGNNLCDPGSDDNVSHHLGTPETLHFMFAEDVIIENIWLNNNHDGDRSLLNDVILVEGSETTLTNGGYLLDSLLNLDLIVGGGDPFDVGFFPNGRCYDNNEPNANAYKDCEFYVSKIEFSTVPEPTTLTLLGLGLLGMGVLRKRQK